MQIILVQKEVEQAIKEYIGRCFTITEGTAVDIELSSTRGTEGTKAIIDLTPAGASAVSEAGPKASPVTRAKRTATPVAAPAPVAASSAPAAEPEAATEIEQPAVEAAEPIQAAEPEEPPVPEDPQAEETPASAVPATTEAAPADVKPVKSLFANLKKPQNIG